MSRLHDHPGTLVVGLGGVGCRVLRCLQEHLEQGGAELAPCSLLGIDLGLGGAGDLPADGRNGGDWLCLDPEECRRILANLAAWRSRLGWLPLWDSARISDEVAAISAGGHRWLGRLAFWSAPELLGQRVRRRLNQLQGSSPAGTGRIILIASTCGGMGSGILYDLLCLTADLCPEATRLLFLSLPGLPRRQRLHANGYACIRELVHLKNGTLPVLADRVGAGDRAELWQRIYLFGPKEQEEPPFPETVARIAGAVLGQLHRRLGLAICDEVQYEGTLVNGGNGHRPHHDRIFSACGCFQVEPWDAGPAAATEGPSASAAAPVVASAAADGIRRLETIHVGAAVARAADRLSSALAARLEQLHARAEWEGNPEIDESHKLLSTLEAILGAAEVKEGAGTSLFRLDEGALAAMKEYAEAEGELSRGVAELVEKVPDRLDAPLSTLGEIAATLSGQSDPEGVARTRALRDRLESHRQVGDQLFPQTRLRRFLTFFRRSPRRLQENLRNRVATLLEILATREFRAALEGALWGRAEELRKREAAEKTGQVAGATGSLSEARDGSWGEASLPTLEWCQAVRSRIREVRQTVFKAAPSGPERRTYALVLLPGIVACGKGCDALVSFLTETIHAELGCICRFLDAPGDRLWIYYEDLFHGPCELARLPELRAAYSGEPCREVLHIDCRLLNDPRFTDLCADDVPATLFCGNPGCTENIAELPRKVLVCPGCHHLIRSRCGNEGCKVDALHLRPERLAKTCPGCAGFNHSAWWCCCRHGKVEVHNPLDKERCPLCIERHQVDPARYPVKSVSIRPDLLQVQPCPHCSRLAEQEPSHPQFQIQADLLPFYRDGVDGHDRERMAALVTKYKLPEGFRCPSCLTFLIPVHHAKRVDWPVA